MNQTRRLRLKERPVDHLPWVGLVVFFLAAGRSLQYEPPNTLALPFLNWPLPDSCWSRRFLNIPCPGCGLTRSVVATLHGQWANAWHLHPVGPVLVTWAILQLVGRLTILFSARKTTRSSNDNEHSPDIPNTPLSIARNLISSKTNLGFIALAFSASCLHWLTNLSL